MNNDFYTAKLGAGQGIINETFLLLELWTPGMDSMDLYKTALESGQFPNISARRLKNLVFEGFATRYLGDGGEAAILIKRLQKIFSSKELSQILFIYTCRDHKILFDFIRDIYWDAYSSGQNQLSTDEAHLFVTRANQDGKTRKPWSNNTIRRVSGYLTGCCADFGLLEGGSKSVRNILPFRIESRIAIFLAYDLHFSGHGDNSILSHPEWALFGLDRSDVLNELKRLSLKGWFIIQSAGDVTRIGWQYQNMEELIDAFIKG